VRYRDSDPDSNFFVDLPGDETWLDVTGHATMRGVRAGHWTVAIVLSNSELSMQDAVLTEIPDVDVVPRQYVRDPRLQAIDLRGKLRHHRFFVTDPDGRSVSGSLFRKESDESGATWVADFDEGDIALVTAAADARPIVLAAERFRPLTLEPKSKESHVVLPRGIPIRVVLDPAATLQKTPGAKLYVGVPEFPRCGRPPDPGEEDDSVRTFEIEAGGSVRFEIPEPGDWRVVFLSSMPGPDGDETFERRDARAPTIHVEDADVEQTFVVAPAGSPASDR